MSEPMQCDAIIETCGYDTQKIAIKEPSEGNGTALMDEAIREEARPATAPQGPALKYGLFLLVISFVVYAQAVTFPFLNLDDSSFIVQNQYIRHWQSLPSYFVTSIEDPYAKSVSKIPSFYRPVTATWLLVNYKVFGLHPSLWHAAAIALFTLGVWLLWRIAWLLTRDDAVALAAGLLYALHPLHVEGVAWLSGAYVESLMAAFFLGGFLAYLRWREDRRLVWLIISGLLALFALLCKETAAALPVLIGAHALLFRSEETNGPASRRRWLLPVLAMVVAVGAYTLMRMSAIHAVVAAGRGHTWSDVLRTAPLLFVTYTKHAFWPAHLAMWYDVGIVNTLTASNFYLPLAFCIAYALLMAWALLRKPLAGFLMLWWVVALGVPIVAVLVFPDFEIVHDRFPFVALVGLCVLVATWLRRFTARGPQLFGFSAASALVMAVIAAILGMLTAMQVNTWRADIPLFAHAIEVSPNSVRPRVLLATEYLKANDLEDALPIFRQALSMDPNRWDVLFTYGLALAKAGDRAHAVSTMQHAVEVGPAMTPSYLVLANFYMEEGRFDEADALLEKGIPLAREPEFLRSALTHLRQRHPHPAPLH
jgi:thioredoxin-like negative regulator of GroEL